MTTDLSALSRESLMRRCAELECERDELREHTLATQAQIYRDDSIVSKWRDWANELCMVAHTVVSDDTLRAMIASGEKMPKGKGEAITYAWRVTADSLDSVAYDMTRGSYDQGLARGEAQGLRKCADELEARLPSTPRAGGCECDELRAVVEAVRKVVEAASVRAVSGRHVDYRYASGVGDVASRVAEALNAATLGGG